MSNRSPISEQRDQLPLRWRMAGLHAAFDEVAERFGPDPAVLLLPAQLLTGRGRPFVLLVVSDDELVVVPADGGPGRHAVAPVPWAEVVKLTIDVPGLAVEVCTADAQLLLREVGAGMGGPLRLLGG